MPRPWWFVTGGAGGWLLAAIAATWGAFRRKTLDAARGARALVAIAIATPLAMLAWMMSFGASCDVEWPHKIGFRCLGLTLVIAVLPLIALMRARRGANPSHPVATGAALGAASAAWAGFVVDLWCPIPHVEHVLVGHIVPMVVLTGIGAVLGRTRMGDPHR
jgi:hypothetical protein